MLNLAKRRILKKCIQFLNHYRGCKKVTVFLGARLGVRKITVGS